MRYLKQSTAVEVKIGPFLDSGDGNTVEDGLTIEDEHVLLAKNGGDWAAKAETTTAVHESQGWYRCLLDTTDTNTLGILMLQVHVSGALPVWVEFSVLPANVYDSLFSTDLLQVDAREWLGGTIATPTVTGVPEVDLTHWNGTAVGTPDTAGYPKVTIKDGTGTGEINTNGGKIVAVETAEALTANNDKTGYGLADDAITAAKFDESTAFPLKANDAGSTQVARVGADSDTLETLSDEIAAVKGDTAAILTDTGTDGVVVNTFTTAGKAEVQQEATDALNAYDPPTKAELDSGLDALPTAAEVVNEWESQAQADPTGFHVNVMEIGGTAQTANDNGADINAILVDTAEIGIAGAGLTEAGGTGDHLTALATQASVNDIPTNSELTTVQNAIVTSLHNRVKKNTALANFPFVMYDTDGDPATGLTVTAERSLDGGNFAACANSASEIEEGAYKISLAAGDLNADTVLLKFTASGAKPLFIQIVTQATS